MPGSSEPAIGSARLSMYVSKRFLSNCRTASTLTWNIKDAYTLSKIKIKRKWHLLYCLKLGNYTNTCNTISNQYSYSMFAKGGNITTESFLGLSRMGAWTRMQLLELHLWENDSSSNSGQIMELYCLLHMHYLMLCCPKQPLPISKKWMNFLKTNSHLFDASEVKKNWTLASWKCS